MKSSKKKSPNSDGSSKLAKKKTPKDSSSWFQEHWAKMEVVDYNLVEMSTFKMLTRDVTMFK